MNKKFLGAGLAVVLLASLAVVKSVDAHSFGQDGSLITRLAERFGVEESQVEEVFEQYRLERHSQREAQMQEYLDSALENGQLNQEQYQQMLAFHEEMEALRADRENLSPDEIRQVMDEHRQAVRDWAASQNLDLSELHPVERGSHHGMGMGKFGSSR